MSPSVAILPPGTEVAVVAVVDVGVKLAWEQAARENTHSINNATTGGLLRMAPIIAGFSRRATPGMILMREIHMHYETVVHGPIQRRFFCNLCPCPIPTILLASDPANGRRNMTMVCSKCGQDNPPEARFCGV